MHGLSAGMSRLKGSKDDGHGARVIVAFGGEDFLDLAVGEKIKVMRRNERREGGRAW